MSMAAQNLRFVRCPKCLQLLVEYPNIPVYQCGGCGTVLRAKNRGAPVTHPDSGSGEQNNSPRSLEGSTQTIKSISSDEQKVVSACTQPSENVVDGNINPERTLSVGESATSGEVDRENCSLVDGNAQNPEFMIKETDDKGPADDSSLDLIENVQKVEVNENGCSMDDASVGSGVAAVHSMTSEELADSSLELIENVQKVEVSEKGCNMDDASVGSEVAAVHSMASEELADSSLELIENAHKVEVSEKGCSMDDASVGSEVAAVHSMASEELADSSNNMGGEIESMAKQKYSASNKNMTCHEVAETNKLYEEDGATSNNKLSQKENRLQPYEVLIESYEDLIEELERSLSLSDDEDDFSDVADNNGLNDALHNQIGSRRFLSVGKMNDDPRSDPHGRLIEELERSFSDADEPLEHHVGVADRDIQDKVHGREHDEDPHFLVSEAANTCEGSMSSADGEHIQSEQNFEQKELTAEGTEEKEEGWTGDDNKIDHVHGNEHVVLTNRDIPDIIHEDENEHDNKIDYVDGNENVVLVSKDISDIIHENEHGNKIDYVHGKENVVLTNEDIPDIIHENEHDKDPLYMDTESANPCERSISSSGGRHLISGQKFQQSELTTDESEEKDNHCIEDDNKINCFHANEHVVVTNKDIAGSIHENEHDISMIKSQYLDTESANLCEGAISSFNDGLLKSGQSFEQHQLTSDGTEGKEDHTEDDNMPICVQADNPVAVADFSSLSNERIHCKSPSFMKKKEEISCRYRASLLRQGLSLDSEDFTSIQKFIESRMDGTSSSLSSGSPSQGDLVLKTSNKFKAVDQLERFKKMDGLRDQINRLSSQKGLEIRYQTKDLEYQPQQLNTYDAEQQFQSVDADSVPSSCTLDSYYGPGKPPRYPPPNPFSPAHSYAHYSFGHAQAHIPHNFDAWEFNSYYQSSQAGNSSILDHDSLKSSFKEQKRVVRKHILRPLSGASPYIVCNSCFYLVQIPSDIYMSKGKVGKMQCGKCSRVIVLSVPAVNHADANIIKELTRKSSKVNNRIVDRTENASYPISVNEEHGASFTRNLSTRAGRALAATESSKKVSDSALHLLMGYDSATQLLRHSRAFERHSRVFDDGYESFESMVPVSNRVSRRKNM